MYTDDGDDSGDLFKKDFKYYKRKAVRPDLSNVIDFERPDEFPVKVHARLQTTPDCSEVGLVDEGELRCYSVPANRGLLVIPNPFTPRGQRQWVSRTLRSYPQPPNCTNLKALKPPDVFPASPQRDDFYKNLRWVTLGLHHDWDSKVYDLENATAFPSCLSALAKKLATLLGHTGFEPEAAIVNYYAMNSTLSGHVDRSEFDLSSPLFSVSFGQTAVFLIGGATKDVKPTAMFLKSGDVVVMTGESRLAYHAVPLVLPREDGGMPWNYAAEMRGGDDADGDWGAEAEYLANHRINLNVRQVFEKS
ncbi:nucleic acid dioxygenase ALKBH1 [Rhipicephalus sanguineus]|uniref:nucleic acid dioxygenase ALKBH1 n=1 Tax=Rhipicephalus sanguineus TaxID=34632 RepID=UPI0018953554|nr:nucleic acid dioxygenase ALKBH1 [Rhipicephalus sanguineus]